MKLNKLQIKNIIISVAIALLIIGLIVVQNANVGSGFIVSNNYIYFADIIVAIYGLALFAYLTFSKYFSILNVNRFNKHSIHNILNVIVLYVLVIVGLVMTNTINPLIGIIAISLEVIFFVLFIYFKGQHDNFNISDSSINIINVLLSLLIISTCFNNLPFSTYLIPFNAICIVGYCLILIINIYRSFKTFLVS